MAKPTKQVAWAPLVGSGLPPAPKSALHLSVHPNVQEM